MKYKRNLELIYLKFVSKKDLWLGLLIWGATGFGFINTVFTEGWIIRTIMSVMVVFLSWIWFGTNYEINDGLLIIRCGPFKSSIHIKDIKSIKKTRNPLSSAALSMDRLDVRYGYSGMVLISPKDREGFIDLITKENGNINIKL